MSKQEQGELEQGEEEKQDDVEGQEDDFDPKAEIENLKSSVVEELKEERRKRQEAEADRDLIKSKLEEDSPQDDESDDEVEKKVKKLLSERDKKQAEKNRAEAEKEFLSKYKSLSEDSDPSGTILNAVKDKLSRFDTSQAESKEDFIELLEDAYRLTTGNKPQSSSNMNQYASDDAAAKSSKSPKEASDNLSSKEKEIIDRLGWSEEKFFEQKKRRPSYVDRLINSPF